MSNASVDHVTPAAMRECFEQGQVNGEHFKVAYKLGRTEMRAAILDLIDESVANDAILYDGREALLRLAESIYN